MNLDTPRGCKIKIDSASINRDVEFLTEGSVEYRELQDVINYLVENEVYTVLRMDVGIKSFVKFYECTSHWFNAKYFKN